MKCIHCGCIIPPERLEVLPHTTTCVNCSTEQKNVAFMVYPHKTGGDVVVIDGSNKEGVRQAKRAYRRAR